MAERVSFEFEFLNRVKENQSAKEAIAVAAAAEVKDGESVMLDSGTTTRELAKQLRGKQALTVITSSLPIAAELQYDQQIEVLLLGGRLRASSPDLAGALTERNLETLRADVAFWAPMRCIATAMRIRNRRKSPGCWRKWSPRRDASMWSPTVRSWARRPSGDSAGSRTGRRW